MTLQSVAILAMRLTSNHAPAKVKSSENVNSSVGAPAARCATPATMKLPRGFFQHGQSGMEIRLAA